MFPSFWNNAYWKHEEKCMQTISLIIQPEFSCFIKIYQSVYVVCGMTEEQHRI